MSLRNALRHALPAALVLGLPVLAAGPWAPPPGLALRVEEASFAGTLAAAGHVSPVASSMSVSRQGSGWVLRELASLSNGETLETTVLDGDGAVRTRNARQGGTRFVLTYAQGRVRGSLSADGAEDPVDADLGGEAFADGACSGIVLAALPLAVGYQAEFRAFNLRARKAVTKRIRVEGLETVTVPAGTFKAFKAVVTTTDGEPGSTTVWSEAGTRKLVRYEFRMNVGGSDLLITQERQPEAGQGGH